MSSSSKDPVQVRRQSNAKPDRRKLDPGLYVIATPIGNLEDISDRARRVLADVDLIACEDTRRTGRLLAAIGVKGTMTAYHDHSDTSVRDRLIGCLHDQQSVGLVSDAGTPCIADPGFKLVRAAREAGVAVMAVPGANAAIAAMSIAGLPTDRFMFNGFLPAKSHARTRALAELSGIRASLVFYETGPRLAAMLNDAHAVLGNRPCAICRELTKLHETVRVGELGGLADQIAKNPPLKGEIVVVVDGSEPSGTGPELDQARIDRQLLENLAVMKPRAAARAAAQQFNIGSKTLYARLMVLKDGAQSG